MDRATESGSRAVPERARSWGIEAELLTPDEVVARIPFVDGAVIKGRI
ncbi:MAG: hypothetical protein OXH96_18870 [Spirochaetaceae bacterium]|nr:hypothetical protein [Spirochaetaceae bacterium]